MKSDELYYPPLKWYELENHKVIMDEPAIAKEEFEWLFLEVEEDFLLGKTRESMPDNWEDDD